MLPLLLLALASGQSVAQPAALQEGLIALRDGKLAEAKASFESALQQDPKNAFAWASLAETSRRLGDQSMASDAAKQAEQFGGSVPAVDHALASFYTQQGDFAHAARLEELFAGSRKADAQASLRTAELYQRAGDPANAERVLKADFQLHDTDPLIAFNYAQLLLRKLDFAAAEKAVATAGAAHPKDPQLLLVIGVARYGQRQFAAAMDEFLKVIAIDPTIPQPYEFLGKMLEQAGPQLSAITNALETRVKDSPGDALANLVLAKARLLSDGKDEIAEGLLRHSLEVNPGQWEAHYQLGLVLESKHEYQAAADELNRSVALNAEQPMPHYHLARVYDRLGDSERARAERKRHEELSNSPR